MSRKSHQYFFVILKEEASFSTIVFNKLHIWSNGGMQLNANKTRSNEWKLIKDENCSLSPIKENKANNNAVLLIPIGWAISGTFSVLYLSKLMVNFKTSAQKLTICMCVGGRRKISFFRNCVQ